MKVEEVLSCVSWHFEVGSALDTKVVHVRGDESVFRLAGPRFDVTAQTEVDISNDTVNMHGKMVASKGSRIFDMVLGCRLFCPPGVLKRHGVPDSVHEGTCHYFSLPDGVANVRWGNTGSHFDTRCDNDQIPLGFEWCPYISDEPDGWRLHNRIRAMHGTGFRRVWVANRECLRYSVGDGQQTVQTENKAHAPMYRIFRTARYREISVHSPITFEASVSIRVPQGIIP